ncbi:hypothetical protein L9F63_028308, partial [Diploptera punctata]
MGNPHNPAFVPNLLTSFSDKMSFIQRLRNTFMEGIFIAFHKSQEVLITQKYVNQYFGEDVPSLSELVRNTSLLLLNTHFTLNRPRPLLPSVIEVGGLHIKSPKQLPT